MKRSPLPRVGFVSLGCPRNLVDTEVMLGLLERGGFEQTADPRDAEVIVINTCGFIGEAKREAVDTILEMARQKKQGACRKLIVTGCLAQRHGADLLKEIPEIDALLGVGDLEQIVESCRLDQPELNRSVSSLPAYLPGPGTPRILTTPAGSAYLKISEGCDHQCGFCVIPKIRGKMRSRPLSSLVKEARKLTGRGVRELNLIGEDTSSYGRDLGEGATLGKLMRELSRIDEIAWIRLLYAYPFCLGDDVLEVMAESERVCRYIDVPLQHADGWILKQMRRGGDAESFLRFLEKLRRAVPGITLRSTFIVGFPGEREAHFARLLEFLREAKLDRVGAFVYSSEETTPAFELPDDVPEKEKEARRERLMMLQREISLEKQNALIGSHQTVLVEKAGNGDSRARGRLEGQAPEIDGCVWMEGPTRVGSFETVRIESAGPYDLNGRILGKKRAGGDAKNF